MIKEDGRDSFDVREQIYFRFGFLWPMVIPGFIIYQTTINLGKIIDRLFNYLDGLLAPKKKIIGYSIDGKAPKFDSPNWAAATLPINAPRVIYKHFEDVTVEKVEL